MPQRRVIGKTVFMFIIILIIFAGCGKDKEEQAVQEQEKPTAALPEETIVEEQDEEEEPEEEPVQEQEITSEDGAPMVLIPAGEFQMGTDPSEVPELVEWAKEWYSEANATLFQSETPRHTVYLEAFYMDKYEVTNALYKEFMEATGHEAPEYWDDPRLNASKHPVVGISWHDAKAYAEWAGKRLPTEAEWEKAARGGLVGKRFPWGDADPDGTQCNFADAEWTNTDFDDGYKLTAPVGSYAPNDYGLYDMAGNVSEWCSDWDDENYYAKSPGRNPTGPDLGALRIVRGGSWNNYPYFLRAASRGTKGPPDTDSRLGFRCVAQE